MRRDIRRGLLALCLAALMPLLAACAAVSPLENAVITAAPGTRTLLPAAVDDTPVSDTEAQLWFRFGEEPLLAPEERPLTQSASEAYELALVRALLAGPSASQTSLSACFPEGTQVLSTTRQGRLLFVTLSEAIWKGYADEPENWQEDDYWRQEVPLRRTLALQSLAATVTANCDVDTVQVLVHEADTATGSMRLPRAWLKDGSAEGTLTTPIGRDETLLLTPAMTMETILTAWRQRDWQRLYLYVASAPAYTAFVEEVSVLPRLTDAAISGGDVRESGSTATFTLTLSDARDLVPMERACTVRLRRVDGLWRITWSALQEMGGLK